MLPMISFDIYTYSTGNTALLIQDTNVVCLASVHSKITHQLSIIIIMQMQKSTRILFNIAMSLDLQKLPNHTFGISRITNLKY